MYVLTAQTKDGPIYYMNCIMVTKQKECAQTYNTIEDAMKDALHFQRMFHYEDIEPTTEQI